MSKVDLATLASPLLVDGEAVVASVRVNWNGMVPPPRRLVTPLPAEADTDDRARPTGPEPAVDFPSAKQMALVLTGRRLLAWSLGISGRPKQYLGDVPLTSISEVEAGRVQSGSLLRISLGSGAVIDLEALRGERGEDFGAQLRELTIDP